MLFVSTSLLALVVTLDNAVALAGTTIEIVPADFDWKGSQNAKVKIASQSTATISVFLEENCNEEALMLRMDVDANTSKLELPIEIPAYIKNVDRKSVV